jgi:uncharacterized protein (DUF4415 family)
MKEKHIVTYTLEELRKLQARGKTETDWNQVDAMTEEDIDAAARSDPDALPTDEDFWRDAVLVVPQEKEQISLRVDKDVLRFFREQGKGYQTRMNAVLRAFVQSQKARAAKPRARRPASTRHQPEHRV